MMNIALRIFVVFAPCLVVQHVYSERFLETDHSANFGLPQQQLWGKEDASRDLQELSPVADNSDLITEPDRKYSDTKQQFDQAHASQLSKIKQTLLRRILARRLWLQPSTSVSNYPSDRQKVVRNRYWIALAQWLKQNGGSPESENDTNERPADLDRQQERQSGTRQQRVPIHSSKKSGKLSINGALVSLADLLSMESQRRNQEALMKLHQRLLVAGKR